MFIAIIVAFVFLVFWKTIGFGLIVDDDRLHRAGASRWGKVTWKNAFNTLIARLYGFGTFGQDIRIEHAVTIALHALTCVLIYMAFGQDMVSFSAAMLYACNPANNQTSIWMNGRRYQVGIILCLFMFWVGPWGLPAYLMAIRLQVSSLFAPVALGWWGAPIVAAIVALKRGSIAQFIKERINGIVNDEQRKFGPKRLIVVVKTFSFLIFKMIVPGRTMMIYPFLLQWGMTKEENDKANSLDWRFWSGATMLAGCAAMPFFLHGKDVWLFLFMVLATLQCCNFMIGNQNVADRYTSLPNVVMMYFIAKMAIVTLAPYHLDGVALVGLASYYLTNLGITMMMYKDLEAYYEYHLFFEPKAPIPRRDLAYRYINANDPIGAWPIVKQGLRYNPKDFTMLCLAARTLQLMGDAKNSEFYLIQAEQNQYDNQAKFHEKDIAMMREVNRKIIKGRV